jgi:murein hydrolase activator
MRNRPIVIGAGCLAAAITLAVALLSAQMSGAQEAKVARTPTAPTATNAPTDPTDLLTAEQKKTKAELEEISKSISLSDGRIEALKKGIADLDKNSADIRQALVAAAARRKDLERKISEGEKNLGALRTKETIIHASLHERRGVLAEVLAALERMGRNPPPALLVTPEDALSSVRSAILLGAVVPGMRHETEKLVADLETLSRTEQGISEERASLTSLMTASLEEDRRMNLLLQQNDAQASMSAQELEDERAKAEELARKATSLQDLIASLESQIGSVRDASLAAKAQDQTLQDQGTDAPLPGVLPPDKNRIAPAYAFSKLTGKLELPASGDIVRNFGDPDGTGHEAQGMTIATSAGAIVTAPADGWVVYAGAFRSYGQMVIINTGDDFHIVMSGMERVTVRQGQFVVAGEPLAVMGEKRVASAAALALVTDRPSIYIEFRQNGKPVDSRPWWTALKIGKARNDT